MNAPPPDQFTSKADAARAVRDAYESEAYDEAQVGATRGKGSGFFDRFLHECTETVRRMAAGCIVLDVGCGNGGQLARIAEESSAAIGVDITLRFLRVGNNVHSRPGLRFVQGSATALPVADSSVDVAYSLGTLGNVPDWPVAVAEISRVLRPGGSCVLDFYNSRSLNALVAAAHPETAEQFPVTVEEIRDVMAASKLQIVSHRRFQLLPYWGDKPASIGWALRPFWKRIMARRCLGLMLDEWFSSMPVVRRYAARQLIVATRVQS